VISAISRMPSPALNTFAAVDVVARFSTSSRNTPFALIATAMAIQTSAKRGSDIGKRMRYHNMEVE
jgi:hypothetical protein